MKQKALWEQFKNNMLNEAVTDNRIKKLKQMFVTTERGLKTNFEKATRKDIENFINKLNRNEFTRKDGKKYSGSTKADIKKFLRQFYKWLKGENEFYPKEISWLKARIRKDELPIEKEVLSIEEVELLANSFSKIEYKALVYMLFDSGFRIQEMQSVKKRDLTWEEFRNEENCFWIRCNVSKTIARKVPIPLFTEELQAFKNNPYMKNKKDNDIIFNMDYDAIRMTLKRRSKKIISKEITPHHLRHSSATYYSKEYDGNMVLISQRYGWSFSSKELKTYIRNSGAYQKAGARKIYENETVKLKKDLATVKNDNESLKAELEAMKIFLLKNKDFRDYVNSRKKV